MQQVCFRLPNQPSDRTPVQAPLDLTAPHAEALTELLQVFACGEESAAIAFAHLAGTQADAVTRQALSVIAAEESGHEILLRGLRDRLPDPVPDIGLRKALIRFYGGLRFDDAGEHLAGIAALDSGVCAIVSAMLRHGAPMARQSRAAPVFARIHREEGGHVRLSRTLARDLCGPRRAMDVAIRTRESLAGVLALRGSAFEALGVDPDHLFARVRRPPPGLFA